MISVNFPQLDEPIKLDECTTILAIENIKIYSKIIFNLYQKENNITPDFPFVIFNESFEELKNITIVQNPILYDLDAQVFKKMLFNRIIATLDLDERNKIESTYSELVKYFNQQIFEDIEIEVAISEAYKLEDLFKLLKITILDNSASVFEKTQLILNVLKEFSISGLIIFCNLDSLLTESEYNLIIETVNLNQQQVLFLENRTAKNHNAKSYSLDSDLYLSQAE